MKVDDFTMKVIHMKLGENPALSINSLIGSVLHRWAEKDIVSTFKKRNSANLKIQKFEIYGIDTSFIRNKDGSEPHE